MNLFLGYSPTENVLFCETQVSQEISKFLAQETLKTVTNKITAQTFTLSMMIS